MSHEYQLYAYKTILKMLHTKYILIHELSRGLNLINNTSKECNLIPHDYHNIISVFKIGVVGLWQSVRT